MSICLMMPPPIHCQSSSSQQRRLHENPSILLQCFHYSSSPPMTDSTKTSISNGTNRHTNIKGILKPPNHHRVSHPYKTSSRQYFHPSSPARHFLSLHDYIRALEEIMLQYRCPAAVYQALLDFKRDLTSLESRVSVSSLNPSMQTYYKRALLQCLITTCRSYRKDNPVMDEDEKLFHYKMWTLLKNHE